MTKSTFGKVNEQSRHFLWGMCRLMNKKWFLAAGAIVLLHLAWIALPLSRTAAQPEEEEPEDTGSKVLVAGPVGIKGNITSDDVAPPGERVVLMVTNISHRPIAVRMGFRDADDFSTILATTDLTLQPGEGASLPYIEQDNLHRSVIGVVLRAEPEHGLTIGGIDGESTVEVLSEVEIVSNHPRFYAL
ncbi:MAG TPA: hypothetical protein VNO14_12700 [Blastocatellia bacterium]|nr:hypothetical protein [Blastocatellia bacterium]